MTQTIKLNIIVLVKAIKNHISYGEIRQAYEIYSVTHLAVCETQDMG